MTKTKRQYCGDPYQKSFEAKVEKIEGGKVWLDQTCFYPESGGQAGDIGSINGQKVTDTQFDQEKNIVHFLENEPSFQVGDSVCGEIDWERRCKIMRVHAASHIMEHFLFQVFGSLKLVGSHLNEKYDSSTYETEDRLNPEKIEEVERRANEFIAKDLPIETWADEQKLYFRHWRCGEIQMPCGGTHPRNTSEIGPIKLKRKTGGRGRERVITSLQRP